MKTGCTVGAQDVCEMGCAITVATGLSTCFAGASHVVHPKCNGLRGVTAAGGSTCDDIFMGGCGGDRTNLADLKLPRVEDGI